MLQGAQEPLNLRMEPGFYPFYRNSLSNSIAKRYLLQQGNKNIFSYFYLLFTFCLAAEDVDDILSNPYT